MNKERNAFKAGLFIVISLVLIIAIIAGVKGVSTFSEAAAHRKVSFRFSDDIGGLRVGDDVRLGGLKVGVIRSIHPVDLQGAEPRLIVNFTMPASYPLRLGARVGVQQTITGSASLNIENLGAGAPLAEGEVIAGRPDPKTALFAMLGDLSPDLRAVVSDVRTQTVPKVNAGIDRTGEMMTQIRDLVGDTKTDIRGTMSNLNAASGTVKAKVPETMERVNGLLAKLDGTVDKVKTTLEDVKQISSSAKSVLVGNRGKLDGMIASLKTTSDNLKHASAEIRRSPWRLLYKPGAGEMANLNLYDSTRQFADGANSLNDAAQSLRDALQDKQADPSKIQGLVEKLDQSFNNFHQVEDKLWTRVRE